MSVEMTLGEKVTAVMTAEDFRNPVDRGAVVPKELDGSARSKLDRHDWLLYYGVAVGLARTEEPCEPIGDVVERARDAAEQVFARLNTAPGAASAAAVA